MPIEVTVAGVVRHGEVTLLTLQPPAGARFAWCPGQYLSILMPGGLRRSFSMAAPHRPGGVIELHVRRRPGGRFSEHLLATVAVGDRLSVEGPYGGLDWRDGHGPVVLLGTGTGLAPLKALIEHGLAKDDGRPLHLYWGADRFEDLYLFPTLQHWAATHGRFRFTPVLAHPHTTWPGRTGYVQDAARADLQHLYDTDVYACGSPRMIAAAGEALSRMPGWNAERFLTDPFEEAGAVRVPHNQNSLSLLVEYRGQLRSIQAACGSSLLAALQSAGAPILSVCGGKASCGECRIAINPAWTDRLAPAGRTEQRLLANLERTGPHDRLACQILLTVTDNGLAVRLGSRTTVWRPA